MRINDWSSDVCSSDLYTRYGTVFLAAIQAYGISVGLEGMSGSHGGAVIDPGMMFRLTTVITLTGGTLFLMWLGEQITQRGVGQGTSLLIFAGIVAELPRAMRSEERRVGKESVRPSRSRWSPNH